MSVIPPTDPDWIPRDLVRDILYLVEEALGRKEYGPWTLALSPSWHEYLDKRYMENSPKTLRERIEELENIRGVETASNLDGWRVELRWTP